jgi:superfamily I DNA/RNA helicase
VCQVDRPDGLPGLIRTSIGDGRELAELLEDAYKQPHLEMVELLRKLRDEEALSAQEVHRIEDAVGMSLPDVARELAIDLVAGDEGAEPDEEPAAEPATEPLLPRIVVTTLVGAKGLQACHVFVVGVNEHHFPRDNAHPTDDEVCQLIVALTRATKSCHLLSCGRFGAQQLPGSVFLSWLAPYLQVVNVNVDYFNDH